MADTDNPDPQNPIISLDEDGKGGKPFVVASESPRFCVGDRVYLMSGGSRQGPYYVATVSGGTCTLTTKPSKGTAVRGGAEIDASYLESA